MKRMFLLSAIISFCLLSSVSFAQLANHVVIAEVYTGGGSTNATYTNDYVVLYNPTASPVNLSTWSLQRSVNSSLDVFDEIINLVGSIPANSYYLVQGQSAGSNGVPLPVVPSANGSNFNLTGSAGQVALVDDQTSITGAGISDPNVVDFVGYGASTTAEGSPVSPVPTTSQSMRREDNSGNSTYGTNGSGWDTNDNSADFYIQGNLTSDPPRGQSFLANHIVIAEIYSGGSSNSSSIYKYDYVVLYNPTGTLVDLSTWSVQREVGTTASGFGEKVDLIGSIGPGSYYLIQGSGTGDYGADLPVTPNVVLSTFNLQAAASKVALVNDQNIIEGFGDINIVDYVGYGTSVDTYEGSPAPAPPVTASICRRNNTGGATYGTNGSGTDSDNNGADFYVNITPSPLPVELSSFTASVIGANIKLNWRTETEVNNYGFEILRQAQDDKQWTNIGFVNGNGNSNSPKDYSFVDENISSGKYSYRLKQIDNDGQFEYSKTIEVNLGTPQKFELSQNYPNPFNPSTTIKFTMPEAGNIKLTLYNILGQEIKTLVDGFKEAGVYNIDFNASELNSGIYIYKIESGSFVQTRKMTLLK
jgi:hypothetical protein